MPTFLYIPSAAGGGWEPDDISNLFAWYKADAITGASNGDSIQTWSDSSGNSRDMSQATSGSRPTYHTSVQNSQPVLRSDGTRNIRAATASDWKFLHSTGGTIGAVLKAGSSTNPNALFAPLGTSDTITSSIGFDVLYDDRSSLALNEAFRCRVMNQQGEIQVADVSVQNVVPFNAFHVLVVALDADNSTANSRIKAHINGGTVIDGNTLTTTPSSSNPSHPLELFATGNGTRSFDGDLGEVVVYDAVLGSSDREKLEGYLAHKWGLTASLPSNHPYKNSAP